jgi:hypothetical protein
MKWVFRTMFFHFICIIVFSILYYIFSDNYYDMNKVKDNTFLDYLLLSTTIQSGVGISGLYPITNIGNLLMIFQQFTMLSTHIFTLYIFTL